jgi:hypothetical protein
LKQVFVGGSGAVAVLFFQRSWLAKLHYHPTATGEIVTSSSTRLDLAQKTRLDRQPISNSLEY